MNLVQGRNKCILVLYTQFPSAEREKDMHHMQMSGRNRYNTHTDVHKNFQLACCTNILDRGADRMQD